MKKLIKGSFLFFILTLSINGQAVTIHECINDDTGEKTFQKTCPPGTSSLKEKKYGSTQTTTEDTSTPDVGITLYSIPDCDSCDVIRNLFDKFGATYTDKNVDKNLPLQKELQELTEKKGETYVVPVVIIGETTIVGYDKLKLIAALEGAGFKKPAVPQPKKEETQAEEATDEEALLEDFADEVAADQAADQGAELVAEEDNTY